MVLLTPALTALHDWRPDLRLTVLVEPAYAVVLEGNPAVAEVLLMRGSVDSALQLRRARFPVVFNQHAGPTSALLTAASGAPGRVCWAQRQFSFLYNVHVPAAATFYGCQAVHSVEHRLTQFYWTGLPRGPIPPASVYPQPDAIASVKHKLAERGVAAGQAYAVLRPGAAASSKLRDSRCWPVEKFAAIARWLADTRGFVPVVDLGPGDREIVPLVERHLAPHCTVLNSLDLRELIALIAGARLFVGNDTGPTHIAAAAGRPVVAIFGSSDPVQWRPWGVEHRVVKSGAGIEAVSTEQVQQACDALLTREPAARSAASAVALDPRLEKIS
jgi:ADP-heptose:LPS heptosyltransferase